MAGSLTPVDRTLSLMGKIESIYKILGKVEQFGAYWKMFVDEDTADPYFHVNSDGDLEVSRYLIGKLQNTNVGDGAPSDGTDGDFYIDETNSRLYIKIDGSWKYIAVASGTEAPFTVEEADGSPTVTPISKIIVGNGDLQDNGSGEVRILTASDTVSTEPAGSKIYSFDTFH